MESTGHLSLGQEKDLGEVTHLWIQGLGALGFVLLLAFTWLPNSYSLMVGWPYALIWQGAFLCLYLCILTLCRQFSIPVSRLGSGLDTLVSLSVVTTAAASWNAEFQAIAWWNFLLFVDYIICLYFIVNWLRYGSPSRKRLWMFLCIGGTVTSVISLSLWRPSSSMWLSTSFSAAIRNPHPLGHHNFVGGYALLVFPIVLSFALTRKSYQKWLSAAASFIVLAALYASGSRGALFGFFVLSLVSFALGIALSKGKSKRRWIITGCCLAIVLSLALLSNPRVRTMLKPAHSNQETIETVADFGDGPLKDRIHMLNAAVNIVKEHPLLGVGPGNLSRVYDLYRPIEAGAGLAIVQQLHNTPAQIVTELGLIGVSLYIGLLLVLMRTALSLHKCNLLQSDRLLLYGISASWFGYGISSLSDYQLENIGISLHLIITLALLINLKSTYLPPEKGLEISNFYRRVISLCILALLSSNVLLWMRADAAFYLGHSALKDIKSKDLISTDAKLSKASKLASWDPTYSALAAEVLLNVTATSDSKEDIDNLELLAIDYLLEALEAAPNDPWFNQNLATLLAQRNAVEAERYAEKAVQLSPRTYGNYTYYTLGFIYLQQGKLDKAVDAFVLESLINPLFLTASLWEKQPFSQLKDQVVEKTLENYETVLDKSNPASFRHRWLKEQEILLSWWHDYPISEKELSIVRPLVQAILIADDNPDEALISLNQHIEASGKSNETHLLQARLSPEVYLPSLLSKLDGTAEERATLEASIRSNNSLKAWLNEVLKQATLTGRYGGIFAYRNILASGVNKILRPNNIEVSNLVDSINLFEVAPREYPELDWHLATLRSKVLELD
ncbi:MAG: O-antigen ligase family protein [Cyanobacteria bacterium P01_D01_bin.105]